MPFALAVVLVNVRMDGVWGRGVFLVLTALACALVLAMGWLAPLEGERPRNYQATLLLLGLALLLVTLLRLAQVLGVERPLGSAGTVVWMFAALTAVAVAAVHARRAAVCALVACVAGTVALLAFVDWVFAPHTITTYRWVLLAISIGFIVGSLRLRGSYRRESVYLVDAAGLAVLGIALGALAIALAGVTALVSDLAATSGASGSPVAAELGDRGADLGTWWELVLLAASFGLAAYAGVDGERGPGYLGAVGLLAFVLLAGPPAASGASLVGWPLLLLLVGGIMVGAGLRPRDELPPEPGEGPGAEVETATFERPDPPGPG